jgi:hypothetical protein
MQGGVVHDSFSVPIRPYERAASIAAEAPQSLRRAIGAFRSRVVIAD